MLPLSRSEAVTVVTKEVTTRLVPSNDAQERKSYLKERFAVLCGIAGPGGVDDLHTHGESKDASFSDMTLVGLALMGFSSPLSLIGLRDVYLAPSVIILSRETVVRT